MKLWQSDEIGLPGERLLGLNHVVDIRHEDRDAEGVPAVSARLKRLVPG